MKKSKFAPPPLTAIISLITFVSVAIYVLPSSTSTSLKENEEEATQLLFTRRIFPNIISFEMLLLIRLSFVIICFVGFITGLMVPPAVLEIPYRPYSKCPRIPIIIEGWRKQVALTSVAWNLLGISFALVSYIGYMTEYNVGNDYNDNHIIKRWIIPITRICWEISAPITLLVSAVVKYALWPAIIAQERKRKKQRNHRHVLQTPRALLQHNANSIMSVIELTLLGGLPIRINHLSLPVLFGSFYIMFSYAIMMSWHKNGQGPAFLYFFLDTTIGNEHTVALWMLLGVLMVFYGLFWSVGRVMDNVIMDESNNELVVVTGHVLYAIGLCTLVCRFRD